MWAIIGGSGFENFEDFETLDEMDRSTPFGDASSGLRKVKLGVEECLFLSRHGSHHELLPSEINYRANMYALRKHGARAVLSFSAVGSLRKKMKPGDLVVPHQYIDRTKSLRKHTFCGDGVVGHVSLAKPVCDTIIQELRKLLSDTEFDTHFEATYVCVEGPYFSTKAESEIFRGLDADIIGMTNFPEYALAREAGLAYLPCCFVTDYDCWDDSIEHVTLEEVIKVMKNNNSKAFHIAQKAVSRGDQIYSKSNVFDQGLKAGLMTPKEAVPERHRHWLEVLLS